MPHNKSPEPRQIFLGSIHYDATPADVVAALQRAGVAVARVRIATHRETGAPRGFGFLDLAAGELRSTAEVIELINLAEVEVFGRALRADVAKERPQHPTGDARERPARGAQRKPRSSGGRGRARSEFQRGRSEFDGPWNDD